jgi:hypothetical protein
MKSSGVFRNAEPRKFQNLGHRACRALKLAATAHKRQLRHSLRIRNPSFPRFGLLNDFGKLRWVDGK